MWVTEKKTDKTSEFESEKAGNGMEVSRKGIPESGMETGYFACNCLILSSNTPTEHKRQALFCVIR